MKIKEFTLNYEKGANGRYTCILFLPHVSEETPLQRFTVRRIKPVIKGLKEIAQRRNLSELKLSDYENQTQKAEDLYRDLNQLISANY